MHYDEEILIFFRYGTMIIINNIITLCNIYESFKEIWVGLWHHITRITRGFRTTKRKRNEESPRFDSWGVGPNIIDRFTHSTGYPNHLFFLSLEKIWF